MNHSPEPWILKKDSPNIVITPEPSKHGGGHNYGAFGGGNHDANAARACACVNACEGIENPEEFIRNVRLYSHETVSALSKERDDLRRQRDELVKALQRIALNVSGDTCPQVIAGDALAKIKVKP